MPFWSFGAEFRETQWTTARRFMLEERRDISRRETAIQAELNRIGEVGLGWLAGEDGHATEQRTMMVADTGSSVCKLLQVYTVLGGNPFDISMFLDPRKGQKTVSNVVRNNQPGGGVVSRVGGNFSLGSFDASKPQQGDSMVALYSWARKGGSTVQPDPTDQIMAARGRKWIEKEIHFKRTAIERRIIKLCDLREQLMQELELMSQAGGQAATVNSVPYNDVMFDSTDSVASIAKRFDGIFYTMVTDSTTDIMFPNTGSVNAAALGKHPCLLSDLPGEEDNSL